MLDGTSSLELTVRAAATWNEMQMNVKYAVPNLVMVRWRRLCGMIGA
jgi:hypothetical protein